MTSFPFGRPAMEPLPQTHSLGFSVKSFRKKCVDSHWHFHPELELIYIEKGQGVCSVGHAITPYGAGEMHLLGANLPHSYGSHPEERTGARWTVMHFLPEVCGREFWQLPQNHRIRRLLAQSQRGIRFSGPGFGVCVELLARLEKNSSRDMPLVVWLELLERLAQLSGRRVMNSPAFVLPARPPGDMRFRDVLGWIEENAAQPFLVQSDAAQLLGMSPQAFCRFFRREAGRAFHRYVNEVRVARACSSLLGSERGIGEIAYASGFNNLANFNRRFREIVGCTPGRYRKSRGGMLRAPGLSDDGRKAGHP